MTSRDFCYWLQGFFEIAGEGAAITDSRAEIIKRHLAMVFIHEIDPSFGSAKKPALDAAHAGGGPAATPPFHNDAIAKC